MKMNFGMEKKKLKYTVAYKKAQVHCSLFVLYSYITWTVLIEYANK